MPAGLSRHKSELPGRPYIGPVQPAGQQRRPAHERPFGDGGGPRSVSAGRWRQRVRPRGNLNSAMNTRSAAVAAAGHALSPADHGRRGRALSTRSDARLHKIWLIWIRTTRPADQRHYQSGSGRRRRASVADALALLANRRGAGWEPGLVGAASRPGPWPRGWPRVDPRASKPPSGLARPGHSTDRPLDPSWDS